MATWPSFTFPPINLYNMIPSQGVLDELNKLHWRELSYLWESHKDNNETEYI